MSITHIDILSVLHGVHFATDDVACVAGVIGEGEGERGRQATDDVIA